MGLLSFLGMQMLISRAAEKFGTLPTLFGLHAAASAVDAIDALEQENQVLRAALFHRAAEAESELREYRARAAAYETEAWEGLREFCAAATSAQLGQALTGQFAARFSESVSLMETTLHPKTFFSRQKDALRFLDLMIDAAEDADLDTEAPQRHRQTLLSTLPSRTNALIDRILQANRQDCLREFDALAAELPPESRAYLDARRQQAAPADDGRIYRVCTVCFSEGGKPYTYLCGSRSPACGDTVTVPVGADGVPTEAKVLGVSEMTAALLPCPPDKLKTLL